MKLFNLNLKIIGQILFVIVFFSTSPAKSLDKFNSAERISNYFSGILLLNENKYEKSFDFLKKLNGLETSHVNYSIKYLYTLVNSGNLKEAFNYAKKLEKKKLDSFESHIIMGVVYLRNSEIDLAQEYFLKAKTSNARFILNKYVSSSIYNWSDLDNHNLDQAIIKLEKLDERFGNLKNIQKVFLHCYFNSPNTNSLFKELTSNKKIDFSRYNYFYASYLATLGKTDKAKDTVKSALRSHPRNLLLNQYKIDLKKGKNTFNFNCKNKANVVAEILYIASNALSSQAIYPLSNFYLNLAKHLNEDFIS